MSTLVAFCALLLIAYLFDLSSSKTRIPSVIFCLLLGWIVHQVGDLMGLKILHLDAMLPVLGTIGLILIVLEGSLELEWQPDKKGMVIQTSIVTVISILAQASIFALLIVVFHLGSFGKGIVTAVPLTIISSAIAIPTVKSMTASVKEFVVYESSLSDIIGILIFN